MGCRTSQEEKRRRKLTRLQILTTAFFSVLMLGRSLGVKRWLSLVILTIGVSVVSIPSSNSKDRTMIIHDTSDHFFPRSVHELGQVASGMVDVARELTKRAAIGLGNEMLGKRSASYQGIQEDQDAGPIMNYSIGLSAVLVATAVSGLTGVYFEKVLKDSPTPVSVWTRNIQLSFYSLFPALIVGVIFKDGEDIAKHGFFDGYNSVVWMVIAFQAIGGVLVSLCINYADNIAKNFATSISIVISFLFSVWFFDFRVSFTVRLVAELVRVLGANMLCSFSAVPRSSCWRHISIAARTGSEADHRQSPLSATRRQRLTVHQRSLTRLS